MSFERAVILSNDQVEAFIQLLHYSLSLRLADVAKIDVPELKLENKITEQDILLRMNKTSLACKTAEDFIRLDDLRNKLSSL